LQEQTELSSSEFDFNGYTLFEIKALPAKYDGLPKSNVTFVLDFSRSQRNQNQRYG
jgi:hypothetical protein